MNTNILTKNKSVKITEARFPWLNGEIATGMKINNLKNGEAVHITRSETISELTNKPICLCCFKRFSGQRALEQHILNKHLMSLEDYSAQFPNVL